MGLRQIARAIGGVFRRDWLIYWRYPLNAIFQAVGAIWWFVPVFLMGKAFGVQGRATGFAAYTGSSDFMGFVILGAILANYVGTVFWSIGYSLKIEMDSGVLESNWLTPVSRSVHLVARSAFSVAVTSIESVIMGVVMWTLFGFRLAGDILPALLTALPMVVAIYGFGFAFSALVLLMREANTLIDVSNFLVNLLTGSTVPVIVLPRVLLIVALALPLTYGYDAVRGMLLGTKTLLPIPVEQALLIGFMAVMVAGGMAVFRAVERKCQREGTLSMH